MSAEENMKLIRAWVDAINRNDVEEELSCWQPDGEYTIMAIGTTIRGVEALRHGGESSASVVSGQPIEGRKQITNLFATAEWACVEYDTNATVTGPMMIKSVEIIPKGVSKTIQTKVCIVFQFRDGKFHRGREYFDTAALARQMGIDNAAVAGVYSSMGSEARSSDTK